MDSWQRGRHSVCVETNRVDFPFFSWVQVGAKEAVGKNVGVRVLEAEGWTEKLT